MDPSCYALTIPGLEAIAAEEIEQRLAADIKRTASGLAVFRTDQLDRSLLRLLTVEDVFLLGWGTDKLTHRAVDLDHLRRWTSHDVDWAELLRIHHSIRPKPKGKPTYRLVVQMEGQHAYHRKAALEAFAKGLSGKFPASWKPAEDNAAVEFWLTIDGATAVCGLRLSDRSMRHRSYKLEHLPASLRPALGAAMVRLAEIRPGMMVLDPMCGAGTLLAETVLYSKLQGASASAINVVGGDADTTAVRAANVNLRQVLTSRHDDDTDYTPKVTHWDARDLPLDAAAIDRLLCNLPFGKQISADADIGELYDSLLPEFDRVLRPGGRAILLTSHVGAARHAAIQVQWKQRRNVPVRVLGQRATILAFDKK